MKLGKWLLTNHIHHERQLAMVNERIVQCRNAFTGTEEAIEQLALRKKTMDEPASQAGFSDPTPGVVFDYEEELLQTNKEMELRITHLMRDARRLQECVSVCDLIVNGLEKNDRWFVEKHFYNGETIASLKSTAFPDGKINSKTFIQNMKSRIVEEVTQACGLLHFHPDMFPCDT